MNLDSFYKSEQDVSHDDIENNFRKKIINIALIISAIGFLFTGISDLLLGREQFTSIRFTLFFTSTISILVVRIYDDIYEYVLNIHFVLLSLYYTALIYTSSPDTFDYIWIFVIPFMMLFSKGTLKEPIWQAILILIAITAPMQSFIEVSFTLFELSRIAITLAITSLLLYFYQRNVLESKKLISTQQNMLRELSDGLEAQVHQKTKELEELNNILEAKVQNKIQEITKKDEILSAQSKQAVMGEMISMIAHQWRQPLSTITLQTSNLKFKRALGIGISEEEMDKTLGEISDVAVYLSDTINDFQTYFQPNKSSEEIDVYDLLKRATNLISPRLDGSKITIDILDSKDLILKTHANELLQVILNILNNAVDALLESDKDDKIIRVSLSTSQNSLKIYIKDNANGISDASVNKIFEPYFSTKGRNGTGLGLYMSQMIIQKQFGGDISVDTSSAGTIFIINIDTTYI